MSRYSGRKTFINNNELYKEYLKERGLPMVKHYATPRLRHPTVEEIDTLQLVGHTWSTGDRFYKIAFDNYGDSRLWWVIAWFNQKPTESHLTLGDTIIIPFPLEKVLQYMDI